MYADTLNSIISYLGLRQPFTTLLDKGHVCRHKKIAMTCAFLGSKLGGVHHMTIMLFTFVNIFIKCHEINSQNKLIIITSFTFEHCHNCLECMDVVMDAVLANLHEIIRWPKPSEFKQFAC